MIHANENHDDDVVDEFVIKFVSSSKMLTMVWAEKNSSISSGKRRKSVFRINLWIFDTNYNLVSIQFFFYRYRYTMYQIAVVLLNWHIDIFYIELKHLLFAEEKQNMVWKTSEQINSSFNFVRYDENTSAGITFCGVWGKTSLWAPEQINFKIKSFSGLPL